MFIGRQKELALLERAYRDKAAALIPINGRRRVGKSELILKFIADKPAIYYLGKMAPAALQIREFLREAARVLDEPLLANVEANNWSELFSALNTKCKSAEKLIIVLDEFQWMVGTGPELPSVLQEYWDRHWQKAGNIMLILCGSYIGFMEREVLGRKSPLFGRRTAQIFLKPFSYTEAADFHAPWSLLNKALVYFICGGIPLYLRFFKTTLSVDKNIELNLLDELGPLFHEPDFLLREELRDVENFYAVLTAVAAGHTTNKAIAAKTGIPERSLHYYVQQLSALGYIGRRLPLTGRKPNQRLVHYMLKDPLLRFWFRFVFPNLSFIQQMGARRALSDRVRPNLESYFGACYEDLCRQALAHIYQRQGVTAAFEIGEFWNREVQIDVVGLRDDHWTDLGECKWGTIKSHSAVASALNRKVHAYPNPRGATIGRHIFLRRKPKKAAIDLPGIKWYGLEDLYDPQESR